MLLGVFLAVVTLCSIFVTTNSRTSTMWKLNAKTGKIETLVAVEEPIKSYSTFDENTMYNFNAMAEVYSTDETFFTIVSSTRIENQHGWLRQSAENSLESLLQARKLKTEDNLKSKDKKTHTHSSSVKMENKIVVRNNSKSHSETLDCGQPLNYTDYDYIINLGAQYKHKQTPLMPEPDVSSFLYIFKSNIKFFSMKIV